PRLAMDEQDIEGRRIDAARVHHRLKLRALVVSGACTGIDKLPDHIPAACVAVFSRLPDLVRNRDIVLGLPCCRNPCIDRNPLAHSPSSSLLSFDMGGSDSSSSARTSTSTSCTGIPLGSRSSALGSLF